MILFLLCQIILLIVLMNVYIYRAGVGFRLSTPKIILMIMIIVFAVISIPFFLLVRVDSGIVTISE